MRAMPTGQIRTCNWSVELFQLPSRDHGAVYRIVQLIRLRCMLRWQLCDRRIVILPWLRARLVWAIRWRFVLHGMQHRNFFSAWIHRLFQLLGGYVFNSNRGDVFGMHPRYVPIVKRRNIVY